MDISLVLGMTRNLSLREFAKRERANSWQSINLALFLPFGLPRSPYGSLAMTGKKRLCSTMTAHSCHFERSEKSKECKIYLKALKSHFKFMDTSLRSVWQK